MLLGITAGDASGIGPEIVLHTFKRSEMKYPCVVYGDAEVLAYYNNLLGYSIPIRRITEAAEYVEGALNVVDAELMSQDEVTPGQLNRVAGAAARAYVVSATRAALSGEISAMVTLPMNKEATQL